ncbi:MAG: hypothetical protein JO040_01735 [Gemmatimonadetes bacterium]|nr:hypothetical protein [Gemmatimonadota bacterium]
MSVLAERFQARAQTPLGAYMLLQSALLSIWLANGGSVDEWSLRLAPAFRKRYGWMLA